MTKPKVKVCGLTSAADADLAMEAGAHYLGFIFYPKSPRAVTLDAFLQMRGALPDRPWGYVQVDPRPGELRQALEAGFGFVQVHCTPATAEKALPGWLEETGPERFWLALKRPAETPIPEACLALVDTFLVDTYRSTGFGGSGVAGNWDAFSELGRLYPEKRWILAGGLNPENVREAVVQSKARLLDVSSGVEAAPGRKDPERMRRFFAALG